MGNKPIYVIADFYVHPEEVKIILEGVEKILFLGTKKLSRHRVINIRESFQAAGPTNKLLESLLIKSLDDSWGDKINGLFALENLSEALINLDKPFFSFLVTSHEMHDEKAKNERCLGLALPGIGAIISVSLLREQNGRKLDALKILTLYLTGLVLGLKDRTNEKNKVNTDQDCRDRCIMKTCCDITELLEISKRQPEIALCQDCQEKLEACFAH